MNINVIKNIIIKEVLYFFDNISTVILFTTVFILHYYFFIIYFFEIGTVSLISYFSILPWVILLYVPAITMSFFAKESEQKTLNLLLTKPISKNEIIVSKIIAATIVTYIPILMSLALPIYVNQLGSLDIGEVFAGYLSAFIYTISMVSLGFGISSFFKNQVAGFLITTVVFLVLNLISTPLFNNTSNTISKLFFRVSTVENYNDLMVGSFDLDRISYFIMIFLIGYSLTYFNLLNQTTNNIKVTLNNFLSVAISIIILFFVLLIINQNISYRLDFTSNDKFTLSDVTKSFITQPENKVKVDVYVSKNLPSQLLQIEREVNSILNTFKFFGKNNIEIQYLNPEDHKEAIDELGIQPRATINRNEEEITTSVKYFSIVVSDQEVERQEIINVDSAEDLELELIRSMNTVLLKDLPSIAYLTGLGDNLETSNTTKLQSLYKGLFEVSEVQVIQSEVFEEGVANIENESADLELLNYDFVILNNPSIEITNEIKSQLIKYYENGGNLFVNIFPYQIENLNANANLLENDNYLLLNELGLVFNQNILFDTINSADVPTGNVFQPFVKFPFYPVLNINNDFNDMKFYAENIFTLLGSSLSIDETRNWIPIYTTSRIAGEKQGNNINLIEGSENIQGVVSDQFINSAQLKNDNGGSITATSNFNLLAQLEDIDANFVFLTSTIDINTSSINYADINNKKSPSLIIIDNNPNYKYVLTYAVPFIGVAMLVLIWLLRIYRNIKLSQIKN